MVAHCLANWCLKRVKLEHDLARKDLKAFGLISPLYASILKLSDGGPISRQKFAQVYGLYIEGLNPKRIKILKMSH
jgi:hypothetical protein